MQVTNIPINEERRETTRPGRIDFPIAVYHSVMSANVLGYTKLHWNEELQFCLVTYGKIRFFVEEENFLLDTGDGIFINSGYLHMARPVDDPDSTYICLDVHARLLSGFPGSAMENKYFQPLMKDPSSAFLVLRRTQPWHKEILEQIQVIYEENESGFFGYELEILASLYRMFAVLAEHRPSEVSPARRSHSSEAAQKILSYMTEHYSEKITLSEIAASASFAESECCRIFKRYTGETIFNYLRDYRLEQSTFLLSSTSQSVSEIAYNCGFQSTSYYIKAFRAQFHTTPRKYREQSHSQNRKEQKSSDQGNGSHR